MKKERKAVLISFSVKSSRFESHYERNTFFRKLYGWKQIIRKEVVGEDEREEPKKKVYTYHREGLLDEMPHERVDQSSFIVPEDDFEKIEEFFEEWGNKVMWRMFKVLLDKEEFDEMEEEEEVEE